MASHEARGCVAHHNLMPSDSDVLPQSTAITISSLTLIGPRLRFQLPFPPLPLPVPSSTLSKTHF